MLKVDEISVVAALLLLVRGFLQCFQSFELGVDNVHGDFPVACASNYTETGKAVCS